MNSIVERLRIPGDEVFSTRKKWQLADLIEQQAERIKELEVERDAWEKRAAEKEDQLVRLRQRIDDAHVHDKRFRMTFSGVQEISLICREDLT